MTFKQVASKRQYRLNETPVSLQFAVVHTQIPPFEVLGAYPHFLLRNLIFKNDDSAIRTARVRSKS